MNGKWTGIKWTGMLVGILIVLATGMTIYSVFSTNRDKCTLIIEDTTATEQVLTLSEMHLELKEHEAKLKSYIYSVKAEIEVENAKLTDLDKELSTLESQYCQLLKKRERLRGQIDRLMLIQ